MSQKLITGPIKVLELIHNSGITGPGKVIYGLAKYLDRREFSLDVLCPKEGYLSEDLQKIGVRVIPLELSNLWNPKFIFRIWNTLKRENYHIFHFHSGQLNVFSKIIGKLLGTPVIIFSEHLCAESHVWIKSKVRLFIHLLFHRLSNAMVDKIIAVSDTAKDSFLERQKTNHLKIVTIYNGVDVRELKRQKMDTAKIRERWGISQDAPVVGMVARLSPEKGQQTFILAAKEALRKAPQTRFLIVGEGPERRNIGDLIERLDMKKNFILTGFQPNIYELMGVMDILVQPSLNLSESFGLAVVEAMAKHKAVIVSDIGAFREIIEDNKNGLMFPPGDYFKLAEKIILLLSDPQLRERIGLAGQKDVENNFDIGIMVRKTQDLYKEALASKGFYLRDNYLRKIITDFMDSIKKERSISLEKIDTYLDSLENYLAFIKDRRLSPSEAEDYLKQKDNFLIESFLQFLEQRKFFMDRPCLFNNRLFKKIIQNKSITAKDYDERLRMQTPQFQIDNYYHPKDQAQRRRIDIILSILQPKMGERILDVGCGVGTFAYHCAKKGANASGVDYSKESIEVAKQLVEFFGVSESIEFKCCDVVNKIPYADISFDKVVAADFIEHIDDSQKKVVLLEMLRVLKPEGFIVIFTPNGLRERLGSIKTKLTGLFGRYTPETRLHCGLINRFRFERILKGMNLTFIRQFFDVNMPYLARIPIFKEILSLNILWVIKNRDKKNLP